jgi:hypothetical protein
MSLTFKQYVAFMNAPLDEERLDEWPWSSDADKAKAAAAKKAAYIAKLELRAKRNDLQAQKELDDIRHADKVEKLRADADEKRKSATFNMARDRAEADDRGSSRAYDRETGSIRRAPKGGNYSNDPTWGHETVRR